ncbi:MAG TPA: oligopeptidase B, partial [Erwinia sp.]|nr:oligopeptidase B [Erwinia sp.]
MKPPVAKKIPYEMKAHGETRIDNYYWLRDDKREDPAVLDYLHAENDYGQAVMHTQQALQNKLLKEMVDRVPQRDSSVPYVKNGYRYQRRYDEGNEYAVYTRQPEETATPEAWEVLIDGNQRA